MDEERRRHAEGCRVQDGGGHQRIPHVEGQGQQPVQVHLEGRTRLRQMHSLLLVACLKLMVTQLPALLGQIGVSSQGSPFLILVDVLRHIGDLGVDAAFGVPTIVVAAVIGHLYVVMANRHSRTQRLWNFVNTMRFPAIIGFSILISYSISGIVTHRDKLTLLSTYILENMSSFCCYCC